MPALNPGTYHPLALRHAEVARWERVLRPRHPSWLLARLWAPQDDTRASTKHDGGPESRAIREFVLPKICSSSYTPLHDARSVPCRCPEGKIARRAAGDMRLFLRDEPFYSELACSDADPELRQM